MTTLHELLSRSYPNNAWIEFENLEVYCRHGPRLIENKKCMCFDIANINSNSPGGGSFGRFLTFLILELEKTTTHNGENWVKYNTIFVENVLNPRLAKSLIDHYNFKEVETFTDITGPPCFVLRIAE